MSNAFIDGMKKSMANLQSKSQMERLEKKLDLILEYIQQQAEKKAPKAKEEK